MTTKKNDTLLPMLPLRDIVVFPNMVVPLFIGRESSLKSLEEAMNGSKQLFLCGQKDPEIENPSKKDIYETGVVATVLQLLSLPDGTVKILIEGLYRAKMTKFIKRSRYFAANVTRVKETKTNTQATKDAVNEVFDRFENYITSHKDIPDEVFSSVASIKKPSRAIDGIAAQMSFSLEVRQKILETHDVLQRAELLNDHLESELDMMEVEQRVQGRVKRQVENNQRQYYLNEKIKAIQKEMGDLDDSGLPADELSQLEEKIKSSGMTHEAVEKCNSELTKLKLMPPMSAEATVLRNYLDVMLQVPWKKSSRICHDLIKSKKILDKDHYGLVKVKERILENLAVQQRVKKLKGPIICLVGPPGVGKTSLGKSIASATGREFVRMSLGGMRDEAEIRGHRKTYIGAMPGRIMQKLSKVKVKNPLFMLDEVDKMASDFRGDPASALLEVLDSSQNNAFADHYLEVDYDLSNVMFIATANSLDIPKPLLDRMEVIHLSGYTEHEKLKIAKNYLLPRQIKDNGLKEGELAVSDSVIKEIVRSYTRESGVRNLERELSKIARKVVYNILLKDKATKSKSLQSITVSQNNLEKYLGVKRFRFGLAVDENQVGQVTGLAWTEVGGELLTIEAQTVPGKGKSQYTGQLGSVMQESIHAALTVIRSRSKSLGIESEFFQENDWHVHVPEGATPKDGPSAGVGMCTALVSAITSIPVCSSVAMTGEITLRGEVLPIGGLKEKLLAALRGEITDVIIPHDNKRDLKDIPKEVLQNINIHPVKWIDEVFAIALSSIPSPLTKRPVVSKSKSKRSGGRSSKLDSKAST